MRVFVFIFASLLGWSAFAECTGQNLTQTEIVGKYFSPGESAKILGNANLLTRTRNCTDLTACGEWSDWSTIAWNLLINLEADSQLTLNFESQSSRSPWYGGKCYSVGNPNTICDISVTTVPDSGETEVIKINGDFKLNFTDACLSVEGSTPVGTGKWQETQYDLTLNL